MGARGATIGVARKVANVAFQCKKRMFHRGLANLFKLRGVVRCTAHSIEILWNHWVIVVRQRKPVERLIAVVTGICSHRQADLRSGAPELLQTGQIPNNDVGPRDQCRRVPAGPRLARAALLPIWVCR